MTVLDEPEEEEYKIEQGVSVPWCTLDRLDEERPRLTAEFEKSWASSAVSECVTLVWIGAVLEFHWRRITPLSQEGGIGLVGATLRVAIRRWEIRWRLEYRGV
ncbi:MAG: hypothetical protein ACRESR_08550 [Gammaproteobacteria bacterium]